MVFYFALANFAQTTSFRPNISNGEAYSELELILVNYHFKSMSEIAPEFDPEYNYFPSFIHLHPSVNWKIVVWTYTGTQMTPHNTK